MTQEVVETVNTSPALMVDDVIGEIESKDILSPRILLMQAGSDLVTTKGNDIQSGDLIDSITGDIIAGEGETIEFVILKAWKSWVKMLDTGSGKPQFVEEVPYNTSNSNTPRETMENGKLLKNFETHNYMVLLTKDLKDDMAIPMTLAFKSTGLMASKAIKTYAGKLAMSAQITGKKKKSIVEKVFEITTEFKDNDKGKYYIPKVKPARTTNKDELKVCKAWSDILKTSSIKVDDEFKDTEYNQPKDVMDIEV